MEYSFEINNGHVYIVDGTIQIESSIRYSVRRLFERSKLMFMLVFVPVVWALSSLVIDQWLFPAALGRIFLVFLTLLLLVTGGLAKLVIVLPTGITAAKRISVDDVDNVIFEESRFGATQVTIHYEDSGGMKKRQIKLPWPGQTAEELEASRRVFEAHGIDTDRM